MVSGCLRRSPDVFSDVFGAQPRKANDDKSMVRSTLLLFFSSGGPSGWIRRFYEFVWESHVFINLGQDYQLWSLSRTISHFRLSKVIFRTSVNCWSSCRKVGDRCSAFASRSACCFACCAGRNSFLLPSCSTKSCLLLLGFAKIVSEYWWITYTYLVRHYIRMYLYTYVLTYTHLYIKICTDMHTRISLNMYTYIFIASLRFLLCLLREKVFLV